MSKSKDIDWDKVFDAQLRGKLGEMRPGDMKLCVKAWKSDPERYSKQSNRIRDQVTKNMCQGLPADWDIES